MEVRRLQAFAQRLYLRIWLAVVGGVAVLTLAVAWAWQGIAPLVVTVLPGSHAGFDAS